MRTLLPLVNSDNFLFPEDVWGTFFGDVVGSRPTLRVPKIDLEDKGDHYELQADLPGIAKEDIVITYDDPIFSVSAEHKDEQKSEDSERNYVYHERRAQSFSRRLLIPHVDKSKIDASLGDGVLKVVLPKEDEQKVVESNKIEIK